MRRRAGLIGLALLVTAAVEITVLVLVAQWLGVGVTLLLVLGMTAIGAVLLRREWLRAWRALRDAAAERRPPGASASEGLVGVLGALLLLVPGFVSGLVGLLLLLPPGRRLARRAGVAMASRRLPGQVAGTVFGPRRVRVRTGPPREAYPEPPTQPSYPDREVGGAIEGEVIRSDVDEQRPR